MEIKQTVESGCYVWTKNGKDSDWTPNWVDSSMKRSGTPATLQSAINDLLNEITDLRFRP